MNRGRSLRRACLTAGVLVLATVEAAHAQLDVRLLDGGQLVTKGYLRMQFNDTYTLQVFSPAIVPIQLASTRPDIFSVPATATTPAYITIKAKEPAAPTLVKVTATASTAAGVVAQKSMEFTVYPKQKITDISLSPIKPGYQVGESIVIHVRLAYPEPTDSLRLHMFQPYLAGSSSEYYRGQVPWRPGCSHQFNYASCRYQIGKGKQSLDFPITVWNRIGSDPTSTWTTGSGMLYRVYDEQWADSRHDGVEWTVQNLTPAVRAVRLDRTEVTGGESLGGTVEIEHLGVGDSVRIRLESNIAEAHVTPMFLSAVGGPASFPFQVSTDFVSIERVARIVAAIDASFANRKTVDLKLRSLLTGIDGLDRDLVAGEVRRVVLRLSQPAPGPITVALESSDPGRLSAPNEIRFAKGQREASLDLRVGTGVDRPVPVTLRARVAGLPETTFTTRLVPPG